MREPIAFPRRWRARLLKLGINPTNDRAVTAVLLLASMMLATVSLYTTVLGLRYYFSHFLLALMSGIAIQALLFATSWRIGAALASKYFRLSLLAVYLITMTISVFFSFSALLDVIYPPTKRSAEFLEKMSYRSAQEASVAIETLRHSIQADRDDLLAKVEDWAADINSKSSALKAQATLKKTTGTQVVAALDDKAADEDKHGYTEKPTKTGKGVVYRGIIQKRNDTRIHTAEDAAKESTFSTAIDEFNRHLKSLQSAATDTTGNIPSGSELLSSCAALEGLARVSSKELDADNSNFACDRSKEFIPNLIKFSTRAHLFHKAEQFCIFDNSLKSGSAVQTHYDRCVSMIADVDPIQIQTRYSNATTWRDNSLRLVRWTGDDVHAFTLAIGVLFIEPHPLAIGTLGIAVVIDLLVLLCAFLGARPRSYLDLRKPSDLYGSEQEAILTSLFVAEDTERQDDPPVVKKIFHVIKNMKFSHALALEGFAGYIDHENTAEVSSALSLLIALQLAEPHNLDGLTETRDLNGSPVVALRVRLILWLADVVADHRQFEELEADDSRGPL